MCIQLNIYFDYICPYCYRGVMDLLELLPAFPEITAVWIPCESHPEPETAWIHSDIASQVMMIVKESGGDIINFHKKVFTAHFKERRRIDDEKLLAELAAECGVDTQTTLSALKNKRYARAVKENNRLVWESLHFEAVPCYQSEKYLLASQEDVMISKKELNRFLTRISNMH